MNKLSRIILNAFLVVAMLGMSALDANAGDDVVVVRLALPSCSCRLRLAALR